MVLMPFLEGTRHSVDVVLFQGQLVAAFVYDTGPTPPGSYVTSAVTMPTCLPADLEALQVRAAYQCAIGVGFTDGVLNMDTKMTPEGPKLIEINARIPGYCWRDWMKIIYGIDIHKIALLIACGIRPIMPPNIRPRCHIMGVMCVPSLHRQIFAEPWSRELRELESSQEVMFFSLFEDDGTDDLLCNVTAVGDTKAEAKRKLLDACTRLRIDGPEYVVADFLSEF